MVGERRERQQVSRGAVPSSDRAGVGKRNRVVTGFVTLLLLVGAYFAFGPRPMDHPGAGAPGTTAGISAATGVSASTNTPGTDTPGTPTTDRR